MRITRSERPVALFALLLAITLQAVIIYRYNHIFTDPGPSYWAVFLHHFSVSGYDPITYSVVTDWTAKYNVFRHPLLAFFVAPLYAFNLALSALTGVNCVQYVVALFWIVATVYAFLFFYRIVLNILCGSTTLSTAPQAPLTSAAGALSTAPQAPLNSTEGAFSTRAAGALPSPKAQAQALLLSALLFSFGHVLLAAMAPDHFILSLMMLMIVLFICQDCMQRQQPLPIWKMVVLFFLTGGITLNNGLKVFLGGLFTNGRRFFRLRSLLLGVLLPSALIWTVARVEYKHLVLPQEKITHAKKAAEKKRKAEAAARRKAEAERTFQMQIAQAEAAADTALLAQAKHRLDSVRTAKPKARRNPYGRPIAKSGFMRWTDVTTPRGSAIVENLFGESIQLHADHALGDVLRHRPVIVAYRSPVQYVVEALLALLFLAGIWCGRRSRLLWLALSWAAFDMLLHLGLGFGLNEVYIMSCHWIFVIPLALAYLLRAVRGKWLSIALAVLTLYLYVWNLSIIFQTMT